MGREIRLDQRDIDEAWWGFRLRLRRRGFSPTFVERHADDLLGQALLELSKAIADQNRISNPAGWLIHCAWRRTQNLLDKERRRPRTVSVDAIATLADSAPTPEEETLELFGSRTAATAIRFLPSLERRLIEFIYLEGMYCRAAGRAVGLGKSAADRHHRVALSRLRPFFDSSRIPSPHHESST
jgi:RNA polymerase sigma factor (sigma-70 family)